MHLVSFSSWKFYFIPVYIGTTCLLNTLTSRFKVLLPYISSVGDEKEGKENKKTRV